MKFCLLAGKEIIKNNKKRWNFAASYFWGGVVVVAVLGPHPCMGFSLVADREGYSLLQCMGLSLQWLLWLWSTSSSTRAAVVAVPGLESTASGVVMHGLRCSESCRIFPNQGSNPCLLHWQADSLPLSYLGIPSHYYWYQLKNSNHRLDSHEFGWTPGVGDGQGGLACCNSWGRKKLDTTEQLNWAELNW